MRHLIARAEISTKMILGSHAATLRDADIAFLNDFDTTRIRLSTRPADFVIHVRLTQGKLTNRPIRELHLQNMLLIK